MAWRFKKKSKSENEPKPFPVWEDSNPEQSIQAIYNWTIDKVKRDAEWYLTNRRSNKSLSRFIRTSSIFLAALGTLCPLADSLSLKIFKNITFSQFGYIFFAIAASLFLFDKFFGLSSGWMRYISTHMAINKLIDEFQYEWLILNQPTAGEPFAQRKAKLEKMKNLCTQVNELKITETNLWISEFQSNMAQLDKFISDQKSLIAQKNSAGQESKK